MNSEELKHYIDGRYSKLLDYYDKGAVSAKKGHTLCSLYMIFVSVAIAPIQAVSLWNNSSNSGKVMVAILSPTLAFVAGISALFKFHENWLSYRSTWDSLQRERALLEAGAGVYRDVSDRNSLFVERIEAMVGNEAKEFYSRHASQSQKVSQDVPGKR